MPLIISKSALALRRRVDPSTVSKAIRPGGALHPALLPGGRIDRAHPATLKWLGEPHIDDPAATIEELATTAGVAANDVRRALEPGGELAKARVPSGHVSVAEFGRLSGLTVAVVLFELDMGLAKAVTPTRRIDLTHPAALALFARHPFDRDRKGEPIVPEGYLSPACVGEEVDMDHPIALVFLARCLGRVPTEADLGAA